MGAGGGGVLQKYRKTVRADIQHCKRVLKQGLLIGLYTR